MDPGYFWQKGWGYVASGGGFGGEAESGAKHQMDLDHVGQTHDGSMGRKVYLPTN